MTLPGVELVWRSVLGEDGRFAQWVRDLSDRSGVYLIRSDPARFADELLYIGESHTRNSPGQRRSYRGLYRTLTRHFHGHQWSQGTTYDPSKVLVAVILTEPEQAQEYQDLLIAAYRPRDNQLAMQMRLEAWGMSPDDAETAGMHELRGEPLDEPEHAHDDDGELPPDATDFPVGEWE
jgi:hypothetical protein